MSKYKPILDAAVPKPSDPADVPKALGAMAGAVDQALDEQKHEVDTTNQRLRDQVEQMTRNLRYDEIMADAQARTHALAWMAA